MALNATAALAMSAELGWDIDTVIASWAGFGGVHRRMESHGEGGGVRIFDDYAHHPTEVAATLAAARTLGAKRVVAVFQPHLYSRTEQLAREFGAALAGADVVVVVGVYPARERAVDFPGVSGRLIAAATVDEVRDGEQQSHSHHPVAGRSVYWLPTFDEAERVLRDLLADGDLCLVIGAGDIDRLGRRLVAGTDATDRPG
jgi:UDP-N-acetylmuramate--alanine ligase